jgi:Metallo-beta-lactamase superfamily
MKTRQIISDSFFKMMSLLRRSFSPVIVTLFVLVGTSITITAKPGKPIHHKPHASTAVLINNSPVIQVEIHHININNGDASIIVLIHKDGTQTKVLIDGGQLKPSDALVPYIKGMFTNAQFQYLILTHYHNDHYNGLAALEDGTIKSEYYVDLGGYNMTPYVEPGKLALIQPRDTTCPWTDTTGIFDGTMRAYINAIGTAANKFGLKRYMPLSKVNDSIQNMIGVKIPLGMFERDGTNTPIEMRCVAAWGFTQGNGAVVDNWKKGASKNDPTLGFVLECGEFRYFFGGDMGGDPSGSYIDQETTLASGFQYLYKSSTSCFKPGIAYNGHVCGFKADHHGSAHSNNSTFLGQMHASVCVTSAGSNSGWHLPSVDFINRLAVTTPITLPADFPSNAPPNIVAQGFFFTNLYNFGSPNNSLDVANSLFLKRLKTAYGHGSLNTPSANKGYVVFVPLNFKDIDPRKASVFGISYVANDFQKSLPAFVFCHQKL